MRAKPCMADPVAAVSLATPFAGFTGKGVRVAVIDSGVHPDHPHIDAARIGVGVTIMPDGAIVEGPDAILDRLGHGTAVTAAIQEKAPDADILPVRVFRDGLKASAAALIAAIRWSIAAEADIVNLSLGSLNPAHEAAFAQIADVAAEAGVLLVAAREANGTPCYPGSLSQVIGVALDWDIPRETYRMMVEDGQSVFPASGYPRPIPGVPLQRNLYGISFAVAQMAGFVARAHEGMAAAPSVETMRDRLIREIALP